MKTEEKNFGLYLHIPFCVQKCKYCDFLSFPSGESAREQYVDLLCKELRLRSDFFAGQQIATIYVGGGTPSCLQAEQIEQIFAAERECYEVAQNAEVTIEVNPGTVDKNKLLAYRHMGINRLSIGLQSTHNELLKVLGRIHTVEEFEKTYEAARSVGFENISVDLMSALPGQTEKMLQDTLEQVIAWKPEHISCYSLIIEEGTPFYQMKDRMTFPDEEEDRRMYEMTGKILAGAGYKRYEISNYAKPGREAVHNSSYWKRIPYLGVGLGAASFLEEHRFSNPSSLEAYEKMLEHFSGQQTWEACKGTALEKFEPGNLGCAKELHIWDMADPETVTALSKEDAMEEFMFLGLRMMEGIQEQDFAHVFGTTIDQVYGEILSELMKDKLLIREEGRIYLTKYGIDISNYVFEKFLL